MNFKRIVGILLIIIGIVSISISVYIKKEVAAGTLRVDQGQKKVNDANAVLSLVPPETPIVNKNATKPAQERIDAGKIKIAEYTLIAKWLEIGGIVVIVIGVGIIVLSLFDKNKPRRRSR